MLSARGVGALLASVVLEKLTLMRRPMMPALASMALSTLPLILLGAGASTFWLAAASFLAGMAAGFFTVVWETVNYTHIPTRMLSRSAPRRVLVVRILAHRPTVRAGARGVFGTETVAVTGAVVGAAAMLSASLVPSLRRIESN